MDLGRLIGLSAGITLLLDRLHRCSPRCCPKGICSGVFSVAWLLVFAPDRKVVPDMSNESTEMPKNIKRDPSNLISRTCPLVAATLIISIESFQLIHATFQKFPQWSKNRSSNRRSARCNTLMHESLSTGCAPRKTFMSILTNIVSAFIEASYLFSIVSNLFHMIALFLYSTILLVRETMRHQGFPA